MPRRHTRYTRKHLYSNRAAEDRRAVTMFEKMAVYLIARFVSCITEGEENSKNPLYNFKVCHPRCVCNSLGGRRVVKTTQLSCVVLTILLPPNDTLYKISSFSHYSAPPPIIIFVLFLFLFFMAQHSAVDQGPSKCRGFTITPRPTTVGKTPLDE